jgi:uncharacterized protein (TIGR02444 family)
MTLAENLWRFSLSVYARPGVAPRCLQLQDQWGANVNLVLWLLWLETRGQTADAALIARAETELADWDKHIVQPLRQLRRQVRARFALEEIAIGETYQQLKASELQAERVEQEILAALVKQSPGANALPVGTNLRVYLNRLGLPLADQQALLKVF